MRVAGVACCRPILITEKEYKTMGNLDHLFGGLELNNKVKSNTVKIEEPKPVEEIKQSAPESDEFIKTVDSDFGEIKYDILADKVWLTEHGCTFTGEEMKNMGTAKMTEFELYLKKTFNGKFGEISKKEHEMLDKIMVGI